MVQNTSDWMQQLRIDSISPLLSAGDKSLEYWVRLDLLGEQVGPVEPLWELPPASKILHHQQTDGSWRYPGRNRQRYPEINYDLLETFRQLGILVEKYGFDRRHPSISKAASYLFTRSRQE